MMSATTATTIIESAIQRTTHTLLLAERFVCRASVCRFPGCGRVEPVDHFAKNLRRQREKRGWSQEELADRADLHRTEISLLERAGREPRLSTIVRLARSLGV